MIFYQNKCLSNLNYKQLLHFTYCYIPIKMLCNKMCQHKIICVIKDSFQIINKKKGISKT